MASPGEVRAHGLEGFGKSSTLSLWSASSHYCSSYPTEILCPDQYLPHNCSVFPILPFRDFTYVIWFCLPVSGLFNAHRIHVVADDSISFLRLSHIPLS